MDYQDYLAQPPPPPPPASSSVASSHVSGEHNINVVIRVRPVLGLDPSRSISSKSSSKSSYQQQQQQQPSDEGLEAGSVVDQSTAISFPAAGQIQVEDSIASATRSFEFNVVFEPEASQTEVFEHSGVKRLIDMALDGFACTIFAYGQTSTGKTYTLTGNILQTVRSTTGQQRSRTPSRRAAKETTTPTPGKKPQSSSPKNIGLIHLSFAYMFEQIKRRRESTNTLYVITVSYLEVYNEQVLDLLNPSPRCLNVRWSKDKGFYAENLFKVECEDIGDLEGVLEEGCKNRQVRGHSMNETSSRSHSVMTIMLSSEMPDPDDPQGFIRKEGRVCLVDLAGSEKTKRTNSKGGTFVEANNINRSLLVLGNCIACLADPKRRNGHIPYRDSTLTKLLADSLAGNGMTLMIACVSPKKCDSQETINTLRYASRAKRVRMNPVVQMDPREFLILSLKREVRLLRMENNLLKQTLSNTRESDQAGRSISTPTPTALHTMTMKADNGQGDQGDGTLARDVARTLDKHMSDNEILRNENIQLNLERNRLIRDHELVCRENESLIKRLDQLMSALAAGAGRTTGEPEEEAAPIFRLHSSPSLSFCEEAEQQQQQHDDNYNADNYNKVRGAEEAAVANNLNGFGGQQQQQQQQHRRLSSINTNDNGHRSSSSSTSSAVSSSRLTSSGHGINASALDPSSASSKASGTLDLTIRGTSAVNTTTNPKRRS